MAEVAEVAIGVTSGATTVLEDLEPLGCFAWTGRSIIWQNISVMHRHEQNDLRRWQTGHPEPFPSFLLLHPGPHLPAVLPLGHKSIHE